MSSKERLTQCTDESGWSLPVAQQRRLRINRVLLLYCKSPFRVKNPTEKGENQPFLSWAIPEVKGRAPWVNKKNTPIVNPAPENSLLAFQEASARYSHGSARSALRSRSLDKRSFYGYIKHHPHLWCHPYLLSRTGLEGLFCDGPEKASRSI